MRGRAALIVLVVLVLILSPLVFAADCPHPITSPGEYNMTDNYRGAQNDASPLGGSVCVKIAASNVLFDCQNYGIRNDGTPSAFGIMINGSYDNVTIQNCEIGTYEDDIYIYKANGTKILGSTIHDSTQKGLYLFAANYTNVSDNIFDANPNAIYIDHDSYYEYINHNAISGSSSDGIQSDGSNSTFIHNDVSGSGAVGIRLGGGFQTSYNSVIDNHAGSNDYGIRLELCKNCVVEDNIADLNEIGISVEEPGLPLSSNNRVNHNEVYSNTATGIYLVAFLANITNNSVYDNPQGIYAESTDYSNINDNFVHDNANNGINITASNYIGMSNNRVYGNTNNGIDISDNSVGGTMNNNSIYSNGGTGILMKEGSFDWVIENSTIYNNTIAGMNLSDGASNTVTNVHFYANGHDMYLDGTTSDVSVHLNNLLFDNPAGNLQSYTNLTLGDPLDAGEAYSIDWVANPGNVPLGYTPFANKFVNITKQAGTPNILRMSVTWLTSELSVYNNESNFGLWKYNASGWTNTGATLNTSANTLNLSNFEIGSDYGILEFTNCPVLNESGTYTMGTNFTGAPNSAAEYGPGALACVKITASDVLLDCAGYSIANNGTGGSTYGIALVDSPTNVTIQNCAGISDYTYGLESYHSNYTVLLNSTLSNGLLGIQLIESSNSRLIGNHIRNFTSTGASIMSSSNITFENNTADGCDRGVSLSATDNVSVIGNNITNSTTNGVYIEDAANSNISENTLTNNGNALFGAASNNDGSVICYNTITSSTYDSIQYESHNTLICYNNVSDSAATGIHFSGGANPNNNTVIGNRLWNNHPGMQLEPASNTTVENNVLFNNTNGIRIEDGSGRESRNNTLSGNVVHSNGQGIVVLTGDNTLYNNTAYNNTLYGFGIFSSLPTNVTGNTAYDNPVDGFLVDATSNNTLTGNRAHENLRGFRLDDAANGNTLTNNSAYNNTEHGFYISSASSGNLLTNNSAYDNAQVGFYVRANCENNSLAGNAAYNNSNGFDIELNNYNNFTGNTARNNTGVGFVLWGANTSLYSGNIVYGNPSGFEMQSNSDSNTFIGNMVHDNNAGFSLSASSLNNFTNNQLANHSFEGFYVLSSSDNTIAENNISNSSLGIYFGPGIRNNVTDNILSNNSISGIYVYYGSGNLITNNIAYGGSSGIYLTQTANNTLVNNTAYDNGDSGITIAYSQNNTATGNTAHDNVYGFYASSGMADNLTNNTAFNNSNAGFTLSSNNYTIVADNTAYGSSYGISLNSNINQTITGNNVYNNNYGFYLFAESNGNLSGNAAHNNSDGFHLASNSHDNRLTGNSVYNNTVYGFYLDNSSRNVFDLNNASGNILADFGLWIESNYNNITNNNMSGHFGANYGVYMLSGQFNLFDNNYVSSYSQADIYARDSNNTFSNNYVTDSNKGFWLEVSRNSSFTNNTAEDNPGYGFYIDSSNNNLLSGNTMAANNIGVSVSHSDNTSLSGGHFYDNALDFKTSALSSVQLNLSNVIFDSPAGDFQNFTNLTLDDALGAGEEYNLVWNAEPAALPDNLTSVNNTRVNITAVSGSVSIDALQWRWDDARIGNLNESRFEIWKYNGSWSNTHAALDAVANALTLTGYTPGSTYSLLEDNNITPNCQVILASGEYSMAGDYTGAPNAIGGGTACIVIDASDVVFDCAGHSITNDGVAGTTSGITLGVFRHNITLENCNVSGYSFGIDLGSTLNNTVLNSTAYNNTYGFRIVNVGQAGNNTLIGNTAYNNSQSFALYGASNNTLLDNVAYDSGVGFFSITGDNNTYGNCTAYNNSFAYLIQQSRNNTFANSTINNNTYGLYIDTNSNGNYVINNLGYGHNSSAAFILHACAYNTFVNNTAHDNNYGFGGGGDNMTDNVFVNNTAYGNTYGFVLSGYNHTTFANNTAYGNVDALSIDGSNNSVVTGNDLHDNSGYGIIVSLANGTNLTRNSIHSNSGGGINIRESHGTLISGDHFYNNARDFEIASFGTSASANLSGVILDNPSGDFQNYTNISLDDALGWGESYYISWTSQPGDSLNFGLSSVNGTFVTIEQTSGMLVTIDRIVWHWDDSQLGDHNESKFELWKHNQSDRWYNIHATLDTVANTFTLTNMSPQSTYAILEGADCRDEDGDGAPLSYVPGACGITQEDCDDNNRYLVPPFAGLSLLDYGHVYVLCSGTYHIDPPPMGDSNLIHLSNYNVTLDCNGTEIINDNGQATVINGYNAYVGVRNCVITGAREGINLGSGDSIQAYGNVLTNCTTGLIASNTQNASIHDNRIYDADLGMNLRSISNSSLYHNTVNSSISGYFASSQYLDYSGVPFDNGAGQTLFVPNDVFATGAQPCFITADNQSLAACGYWLNGTTDLSVVLNDLSPFAFGGNATILINDSFNNCSDADNWWNASVGAAPPCYFACKLYIANGAGNEYILNESCFNAIVNVSGGLTYPPYIRYGQVDTSGIELNHSQGNLIYNNIFSTKVSARDTNNGYFQDYFTSLSPITYNGIDYNGTPYAFHTNFAYNTGGGGGYFGQNDYIGSDNALLSPDALNPSHSFGVFVANFTRNTGGAQSLLQTVYFDNSNLNWHNCSDVENELYNLIAPGDCKAFCQNVLTSNGPGHNYAFDPTCINGSFNFSAGFTSPPYIHYSNYSVAKNRWNTTKQNGPNIIGGAKIGGNYYSDYTGVDTDGDGIGNVPNYYNITNPAGGIATTDRLPLTNNNGTSSGCVNLSDDSTFNANISDVGGVFYLTGSVTLCRDNYSTGTTMFVINSSNVQLDCNGSVLTGNLTDGLNGINATSEENLRIVNCTIANFSSAINFLDVNHSSISNSELYGNSGSPSGGINAALIFLFSHDNNVTNNSIHNNNFFGVMLGGSTGNTIANNSLVNNSIVSLFVVPFVLDSCDNNIVDNAGGYYGKPIAYEHDTSGITVENSDDFSEILWCNVNNSVLRNVEISNGPGQMDGLLLVLSRGNHLDNISSHNNFLGTYIAFGSEDNVLSNSSLHNNTMVGLVIENGRNNTIASNRIFSNSQAGLLLSSESDNNTFIDNTLYGNNAGGSGGNYDISFSGNSYDGYPEYNVFNNTKIYNFTNAIGFNEPFGNASNFTNLTICYNASLGCISWDFLNLTYANLGNGVNIIVNPYFVSLNSSDVNAAQFNSSANITISSGTASCTFQYIKAPGFPQSKASILATGAEINPAYTDCSDGIATFSTVNAFSGYTFNTTGTGCSDNDGDGANYSYSPGACTGQVEDCNDANPYVLPPRSGLYLNDPNQVYTLCPGTYSISSSGDFAIRVNNNNITLDCHGAVINSDHSTPVIGAFNDLTVVKNCNVVNAAYGLYFGWASRAQLYDNNLTNCTYGLYVENGQQNTSIYNNRIYGAVYGMQLKNSRETNVYDNTVNSSIFGYSASNQYLNHSGTIFNSVGGGPPGTLFIQNDILTTGGSPCTVSQDGDSLGSCPALDGTQDLSVMLNDISALGVGNATLIINDDFNNCSDADAWWETAFGPGNAPPCYFACKLYIANGAGQNYTLNESCYNATVNVSGGLTYPPYVRYGQVNTYGIQLIHSLNNSIYNNVFAATSNVQDSNNGYFQDYLASYSPVTYNGVSYNGSNYPFQGDHVLFLRDVNNGYLGSSDWVSSDDAVMRSDNIDGTQSYGMFVGNFTGQLMTIYFDKSNLNWHNCADVEGAIYSMLTPGDCHAFCEEILASNGPGNSYTFDSSCLSATFNVTAGYTYPPYIHYSNYSVTTNNWNTTQHTGPNLIGGQDIGGNFYADYYGVDTDGDGIGNVPDHYDILTQSGGVANTDQLPLTNNQSLGCVDLNDNTTFGSKITGNTSAGFYLYQTAELCAGTYYVNGTQGSAIAFLSPNITLDCHGATIIGRGLVTGMSSGGYEGMVLQNCHVQNYSTGVAISLNAPNSRLYNVTISDAWIGLSISETDGFHGSNIRIENITYSGTEQPQGVKIYDADNSYFSQLHVNNVGTLPEGFGVATNVNSHNSTFVDSTVSNCGMDGFDIHGSNFNISNVNVSGSVVGIYVGIAGLPGTISNSLAAENYYIDFLSFSCVLNVTNLTGSGNRPIIYLNDGNSSTSYGNQHVSELLLCGAHDVDISNLNIEGSSTLDNNGLVFLTNAANNKVSNFNSSNNYVGAVYLFAGDNNTINGATFANNLFGVSYGLDVVEPDFANLPGTTQTIENIAISGASQTGIGAYAGSTNLIARNITITDSANSINLVNASHLNFSGLTIVNPSGFALNITSRSSNDSFENLLIIGGSDYIYQQQLPSGSNSLHNFSIAGSLAGSRIYLDDATFDSLSLSRSAFAFNHNFVSVDSAVASIFGTSGHVVLDIGSCSGFDPTQVMYASGFHNSRDSIIAAGQSCPPSVCSNIVCNGGVLSFDVAHFSGYAYGPNANLTIYNNGPVDTDTNITFDAEYINATSGALVTGADCNLTLANGSVYSMADTGSQYELNLTVSGAGTYSYNVTCAAAAFSTLTAFDSYSITGNYSTITLFGANITNSTNLPRWESNATAGNLTTEGGNITSVDLSVEQLTDRWAGVFGNVSGDILLTDNASTNLYLFKWPWDASSGGVVCASTNSSLTTMQAAGATAADIDAAWSFAPTAADSAANTFNNTNCTLAVADVNVTNADYANTGTAGSFRTCAIKTIAAPSKGNMLFCTRLNGSGQIYNGEIGNYEMILPTAYGPGVYELYYFYMNLN